MRKRFMVMVDKSGPRQPHMRTRCWVWTGAKTKKYGAFQVQEGKGRSGWHVRLAHRVMWLLKTGEWPERLLLHKCDHRPCVRPSHLYEGDHQRNARDMVERGRMSPSRFGPKNVGEANANAKLSKDDVATIRRLYRPRKGAVRGNRTELALRFGVTPCTITRAFSGEHWK